MKILGKYWKVLLAVALLAAAVFLYNNYQTEKTAFETESKQLQTYITALEKSIAENMKYADKQEQFAAACTALEEASAEIMASRLELYQKFPVEMKEEDQIMYILYLESVFGTEIFFSFSTPQPLVVLRDGATVMGLTMTVNYQTSYQGFKDMITYLATDSRIASVQYANIAYDAASDTATGSVTLLLYLIDSELLDYVSPNVPEPSTGKDNIFE